MCVFTIDIEENGALGLNVMQVGLSIHPGVTALKVICSLSNIKKYQVSEETACLKMNNSV